MQSNHPISAWPQEERPRERLALLGASALADRELLAILLNSGKRGCSALDLAARLLLEHDGLRGLGRVTAARLASTSGVGLAKAARILAACELGRRRARIRPDGKQIFIRNADEAARIAGARLRDSDRERFLLLLLDTKHRLIREEIISVGSLDQALVHPREVFKTALEYSAAALIAAHNHPSGDCRPSREDRLLTEQLSAGARFLGIRFLDHLVIGDGRYCSLVFQGSGQKKEEHIGTF